MTAPRDPRLLLIALGSRALRAPADATAPSRDWVASLEARLRPLVELIAAGFRLVVTHGSRRHLDEALHRMELAQRVVPPWPLEEGVAAAQGALGYAIQHALGNGCRARGLDTTVVSVVTRVVVDVEDPAFGRSSTAVGPPYPVARAHRIGRARGWAVVEDGGLGRRAVPTASPGRVLELPAIQLLVEAGVVPIVCGGGGVPVAETATGHRGVEAMVEPDLASAALATALRADRLALLTGVEQVMVGFGTPRAIGIERLSVAEARALAVAGEFPPLTMGAKVEAGLRFVEAGGREAVITSPAHLQAAVEGVAGTRLVG